ncbi:MAG: cysteine--tRNA ligase [Micavibrio sp.]|nr:cysteine--tRNA ligase [Micavibrio sp.]|tara:strand:- start:354 stop:1745 length:1392 start_codon:yes stop_codon:yes gene_type:complete
MSTLTIFNSLTREKTAFTPIDPDHIRLYACGPTVYNYAHIGNARMAVVFDLLANVLRSLYPKVTYVSNITDVDDKIITAHLETGAPIAEITEKFTRIYNEDMASLGCKTPDIQPRATTHIEEMITLIKSLIERGHAYEPEPADGHVLFNVPSFENYGGLSGRSRDEQIAGARVEIASYKKDPADFVLWKPSKDDEPGWESPFGPNNGRGRPGWHIECSAMAEKHLGLPFDIHGGGADLKFPHHENEIAQSCCAHGHNNLDAFAKYWMHNGFVTVEGEKMSKSLGNFTLAHDLLEKYDGAVLRIALLSAHYRKPLDWSEQALHQAQKQYDRIAKALKMLEKFETRQIPPESDVLNALCNDLNTPAAFVALNNLVNRINEPDTPKGSTLKSIIISTLDLLGIEPPDVAQAENEHVNTSEFEGLLQERTQAKADKNWARADEIRDELTAHGYKIIDTAEGPKLEKL